MSQPEILNPGASIKSGVGNGSGSDVEEQKNSEKIQQDPKFHLELRDLRSFQLGEEGEMNARYATDTQFLNFIKTLVPLEAEDGADLEHWTVEERRDFLNWAIDEGVLLVRNGRLVPHQPIEEKAL